MDVLSLLTRKPPRGLPFHCKKKTEEGSGLALNRVIILAKIPECMHRVAVMLQKVLLV